MSKKRPNRKQHQGLELARGRVIERLGPVYTLSTSDGVITAVARGRGKTAVVGDFVFFDPTAGTELAPGLVTQVEPRRNQLRRADALGRKPQSIAANVSLVCVVVAQEPPLREGLIDRYIVSAKTEGIDIALILNKVDLLDIASREEMEGRLRAFASSCTSIVRVSSTTGEGFDELVKLLATNTSVLVGHSGVGKTSILNRLLPDYAGRTRALSTASLRGQHTTSTSHLRSLSTGGEIIDTPGIRSFGLWGVDRKTVSIYFPGFEPFIGQCRFNDCSHIHEPKCAVRAAIDDGQIQEDRFEDYKQLWHSIEEGEG